MDNTKRFLELTKSFGENKVYKEEGFFRLRKIDEETYDFEYSLPDPCGSALLHPQIRLKMEGEKLVPTQLFDMGSTPVKFLRSENPEDIEALNDEYEKLLLKFENAKD